MKLKLIDFIKLNENIANDRSSRGTIIRITRVLFIVIIAYFSYKNFPFEPGINKGLALLICIGLLWLLEALHITVTALLVPVIAILIGLPNGDHPYTIRESLSEFSNPIIFLFLGGFALSVSIQSQQLDKKIAHGINYLTKSNLKLSILLTFMVTTLLSMWMSNAATVMMMLPIALGLVKDIDKESAPGIYLFLLLGISYSANLGGLGTYVGSAPNAVASQVINYGFLDWLKVGLPIPCVLVPLIITTLYWKIKPNLNQLKAEQVSEDIPWTLPRILTIVIFVLVALAWTFDHQVSTWLGVQGSNAWVAIIAIFLFVALGLTTWREISQKVNWGVLVLFGGGLTLSAMLKSSGASEVLGNHIAANLNFLPAGLIILGLGFIVMVMTEFTSNTATAALMAPVAASAAPYLGINTETLVLTAGIFSSCAFMLPVSTPPNSLVYGTGLIQQQQMISVGKYASLISLLVITTYLLLREMLMR